MTMQVHTDTIKRRYSVTRPDGERFTVRLYDYDDTRWIIRHERGLSHDWLSDYLALTFQESLEVIEGWLKRQE